MKSRYLFDCRKRFTRTSLLILFLLCCVSTRTFAYDFTAENSEGVTIYYNRINDNTEAEVTFYAYGVPKYTGAVRIPATVTVDGTTLNVTSIGSNAFQGCSSVTSVTVPTSVKNIGGWAFQGTALTSVTIPDNVTSVGEAVFLNCKSLASVTIGSSLKYIGEAMFQNCSSLASVTIPHTVTDIKRSAFLGCSSLTSVTIPNTVVSIGLTAFNCSNLTKVIVEDIDAWYSINFEGYDANPLYYAHHLYSDENTEIKDLKIPNSMTNIGNYVFSGCSGLTSIDIPESVTSIGNYAFYGCVGLVSIDIPKSMTSIGDNAFQKCSGLTDVTIPDNVTSIGDCAFYECSGLTSVTIGSSVTSVGYEAFRNCTALKSVSIGSSMESIGASMFNGCSGLTDITIPDNVTSIRDRAFMDCTGLKEITIPNSVKSIGYDVFTGCTSLTSVTIGNSVTKIYNLAFKSCSNLKEVTLLGNTLPSCEENVFMWSSNSSATLYCKTALIEKCRNTAPWSGFGSIKGIPFSITIPKVGIATGCFYDDLDFTDMKVNAYIASGYSPSLGKVLLTRVKNVPAGTGFIVKGAAGEYEIPAVATDYTYANLLVGVLENTVVSATAGSYSNYVLGKDTEGAVGFFQADETTVPANKAYLQILTSAVTVDGTSDAKTSIGLCFNDEEGTTGVDAIREQSDGGETVIYNINGQRKQSLTRGLNIVNGKKIFVK